MTTLHLATTPAANELLAKKPLALLIGMLLDQQIPMQKAFTSPSVLQDRLGRELDATEIAEYDPAALEELFRTPPALHRFPAAMAKRVQDLARTLVAEFDGRAENVWDGVATGAELVNRIGQLPGFGEQKARIFAALLAKQFGVTPQGWKEATGNYGEVGFRSVADVVDAESLVKVRMFKKLQKA
jgi:uncharacterized HhH-GPD family protein